MSSTLVAVGASGKLTTSPEGTTWTVRTSGFGTTAIHGVAWSSGLGLFVAVGDTSKLFTSPDGISWTSQTSGFTSSIQAVAWSPGLNLLVAVGGAGQLFTSPDAVTWTTRTSGFGTSNIFGVAWSPGLNLFIAVGLAGKLFTSPDGTTWTVRTSGFGTTDIYAVAWSPGLNLFVAVGDTGKLSTSPDGITWTVGGAGFGASSIQAVAWSPGLNLFVVAGGTGKLATSPDGTTWTLRTSGTTGVINNVAWAPVLNLFVEVGQGGFLATSPDGTTWTSRTSGFGTSAIYGVAWLENVPPNAPTLNTPATGTTIDRGVTQRLGFTDSDPDLGDSQTKFDLRYKLVGAGSWTTVTQVTPNSFWDAAPSTFAAGNYEWQVRTYDSQGFVGPYCASGFFTAADAPTGATISAPTNGSTISTVTATVTWSAPAQTDYQIRRMDDVAGVAGTTVYYDSGDVVDSATRSVTVAFPVNTRWEHIQVRVKAAGLWSAWADCRVDVSYTAPMVPTLTATPYRATAEIDVVITNPAPTGGEPAVVSNDVYVSSPLDPEYRAATLVPPNSTWMWKTPAAGRVYTVRVESVGSNGTTSTSV